MDIIDSIMNVCHVIEIAVLMAHVAVALLTLFAKIEDRAVFVAVDLQ